MGELKKRASQEQGTPSLEQGKAHHSNKVRPLSGGPLQGGGFRGCPRQDAEARAPMDGFTASPEPPTLQGSSACDAVQIES